MSTAASPDAFRTFRAGPRFLCVAPGFEDGVLRLGLLQPGGLERLLDQARGPMGRARTAVVPLEGRSERLHVRPVRHGGWLAGLWGDRVLGLRRPTAELRLTERLSARGAPVPRAVFVAARRRSGPFWTAALATVHEEGALDGVAFLDAAPEAERRLRACASAGAAVRRLHEAGVRHRDLHVKNLLLREVGDRTETLIVDLDRARPALRASARARMAEIMRLYRSLVRRGLADGLGPEGCQRFLEAYTDQDQRLRASLLAHLPRERRRLARHALGHRLARRRDPAP